MKKFLTTLVMLFMLLAAICQPMDNTIGMTKAIVRMPVKGTQVTRTVTCDVSLENNEDTYILTMHRFGDTVKLNMKLWNIINHEDSTFTYLFDNATLSLEQVYSDSVITETYIRDQFGDCTDTIFCKAAEVPVLAV